MNLCDDNRTATIEAAKIALIKGTNIEDSPDEMKVLDNILLRCWQMGWLDRYAPPKHFNAMQKKISERLAAGHGSNVPMQPNIPPMPSNTSNALKALNSVNATQSNTLDCISRKAAIDKFKPWLKVEGYSPGEKNMLKAVLYELHCMPPTKPKREKTRFVYENGKIICERCGNEMRLIEQSGFLIFCPSCGAEREMKRL